MGNEAPNLTKEDLCKPVQAFLQNDSAEPIEWKFEPLTGGFGNRVSLGVYKVTGTASVNGQIQNWQLALKIICLPEDEDWKATSSNPNQYNYWRREAYLLESGFLEQAPTVFVIPQTYAVVPKPNNIVCLWMEYYDAHDDGLWTLERYARIAELLGQFGGFFLQQRKLRDYEWWNGDFLKKWVLEGQTWVAYWNDPEQQMAFWKNPYIQELLGDIENNAVFQFTKLETQILDKLDKVPNTICHGDFFRSNLMAQIVDDKEQIILIDWAYVGPNPLGVDLGSLTFSVITELPELSIAEVDKTIFDSYIRGLKQAGWQGDIKQILFAYSSALVLRISCIWITIMHLSETRITSYSQFADHINAELVTSNKHKADMLNYYARQALDLLKLV